MRLTALRMRLTALRMRLTALLRLTELQARPENPDKLAEAAQANQLAEP